MTSFNALAPNGRFDSIRFGDEFYILVKVEHAGDAEFASIEFRAIRGDIGEAAVEASRLAVEDNSGSHFVVLKPAQAFRGGPRRLEQVYLTYPSFKREKIETEDAS